MILITGISGFIGAHLLNTVVAKFGHNKIVAISSRKSEVCPTIVYKNFDFYLSKNELELLDQVSTLIHVGSFTPKDNSEVNLINKCNQNIFFTEKLLAFPMKNLKKIIYISSLDVYQNEGEISELSKIEPVSLYGASKLYCERMIESYSEIHSVDFQTLRLGHVYGPGEENYRKFIPVAIKKILSGKDVELWGDGREVRSFIFIDDVVLAIVNAIQLGGNVGPINIVSRQSIMISDVLRKLIAISGKQVNVVKKPRVDEIKNFIFDNSKMCKYLLSKETKLCDGLNLEYRYMEKIYELGI